ncbi:MAG: hypothetical protein WBE41_07560, partial [Terracidiphilus sp.]
MKDKQELVSEALDDLRIELPSWGFANTGTRFGKFMQAAAATTLEDKFSWCATIVGLHFLPLARIFRAPRLTILGVLITAWCILC